MKNKIKNTKNKELGIRLQKIREQLGKVIICKIGVTDEGNFDVLEVETVVPHDDELKKSPETTKQKPFYLG